MNPFVAAIKRFRNTIDKIGAPKLQPSEKCTISEWIPPEIKDDAFYNTIVTIFSQYPIHHALELGASSGEGSTEAFIKGILAAKRPVQMYSIEASQERFERLKERYKNYAWFHPYNVSTVPVSDLLSKEAIISFYTSVPTKLNQCPLDVVLSWREQEEAYVLEKKLNQNGIKTIQNESGIAVFDCVLIDSSAFTGMAEFKAIYGAGIILLDDINDIKNFDVHHTLKKDPNYELIQQNWKIRNGFSVFVKKGYFKPND